MAWFLSTPPMWVATAPFRGQVLVIDVSIHATHVGGDNSASTSSERPLRFLSTPPMWVATSGANTWIWSRFQFLSTPPMWVATHILSSRVSPLSSFYPRHPCGWRRCIPLGRQCSEKFLSTPPMWVATVPCHCRRVETLVSIHATHRERLLYTAHQVSDLTVVIHFLFIIHLLQVFLCQFN